MRTNDSHVFQDSLVFSSLAYESLRLVCFRQLSLISNLSVACKSPKRCCLITIYHVLRFHPGTQLEFQISNLTSTKKKRGKTKEKSNRRNLFELARSLSHSVTPRSRRTAADVVRTLESEPVRTRASPFSVLQLHSKARTDESLSPA